MARPRWHTQIRRLMSFLYTPLRWARACGVPWGTEELELFRRDALHWLYQRAQAPTVGPDGHRSVLSIGKVYSPAAPRVIEALAAAAGEEDVAEEDRTFTHRAYVKHLERMGLKVMFSPDGSPGLDDASHWAHAADNVQSPALKMALVPIQQALELSKRRRWKICPLCGRAFPKFGNTKACPPCRRKLTRRQVQSRLAHAPNDAVVFRITPVSDPQSLRLSIAAGVDAPAALRRLCYVADGVMAVKDRGRSWL